MIRRLETVATYEMKRYTRRSPRRRVHCRNSIGNAVVLGVRDRRDKSTSEYLAPIDGITILERGKKFVETDARGRTDVDRLYAAGRLAAKPHQALIIAGYGAEVAVTLLEDHERGFFHDWVAPRGYFTGRDIGVPPDIEEIDKEERRKRERESIAVMREYFDEPHPGKSEQHPIVEQ